MQLQNIRFFVALAETEHFGAAAAQCGVSQPALSAGLRALEQELGKRLIDRDRRFGGLTQHGLAILPWAEQVLGTVRGLVQAAEASAIAAVGEFRLAAIPAALPLVGPLGSILLRQNPGLTLSVQSSTSREIERGLAANAIDAGITYLDHEAITDPLAIKLHDEQYVVAARRDGAFSGRTEVTWSEVAEQRLCLLHQGMQFRRILDQQFADRGLGVAPAAIADSYVSLLSLIRSDDFVSILPSLYARMLDGVEWCAFLPFDEQPPTRRVGLVLINRDPLGPLAAAAFRAAREFERQYVTE